MTASIGAGVTVCFSNSPLPSVFGLNGDEFLDKRILSTACGALAGGVTAEMFGGNFWDSVVGGAVNSSGGAKDGVWNIEL